MGNARIIDETGREVIAYRLEPIYARQPGERGGLASAATMTCLATGRTLAGMGGGGLFLTPAIVEAMKNDGRGKVVVVADWYDEALKVLAEARAMLGNDPALAARVDVLLAD